MNTNDNRLKEYLKLYNFTELTEIQDAVYKESFKGKNLVVKSVTGSGKTHAFLFPIFLSVNKDLNDLQVVISSPTRELARQIYEMAKPLAVFEGIDMRLYVGGDDLNKSVEKLKKGNPQIAIGTPGRINQLSNEMNLLNIHKADIFVIDEADMTLDSGFLPLVDQILGKAKPQANFEVFSATIPESITPFLKKYLSNPVFIDQNAKEITPINIAHYFIKTKYRDKIQLLKELMKAINPYLAIIYCNKRETIDYVYSFFKNDKKVAYIYGDMEPSKRKKTMKDIRDLKYTYIISTDLTARGLDIEGISHIINYELPSDPEFYIHRTGRTGRMFRDGIAISFYDYDDDAYIDKLEAKGLHTEYKDIKNGTIVDSTARYERERKTFFASKINIEAKHSLKNKKTISKSVKPGYKKKYNAELNKEKKLILKKRTKHE
ncbi:MAG: DEAD/DEAH box helicase [Bacillales bacterium]|nr:DEAD/DEAH box helicase [Bacillales bacterium]